MGAGGPVEALLGGGCAQGTCAYVVFGRSMRVSVMKGPEPSCFYTAVGALGRRSRRGVGAVVLFYYVEF